MDAKDIAPEALAEALSRHGLTDRAVVYQGVAYLEKLKAIAPTLRRMPPLGDPSQLDALAERVRPYAVDARWSILSKPLIDRCHALGIKVFSDAIGANESVEQYQKAIRGRAGPDPDGSPRAGAPGPRAARASGPGPSVRSGHDRRSSL